MLLVITFISFLVHVYSLDYMSHDPYQTRFFSYLSFFTFFMLVLVTADNFLQLFAGWEGVGLCSYLLINFWFTRILANKAALKAMIMNRIADVFFIFAIVLLLLYLGTTDYLLIFSFGPLLQGETLLLLGREISFLNAVAFFLFIGAIGKSAQLGFHTWLPDAMEGPTPVSSLLHAATMVTAGVFLLLRCSPLFQYTPEILLLVTLIGGVTAFFFALVGIFQYDIKKVIAYSTCSQLGYMFLSCGLSNYSVAAFHLFNHAFFKALLFLGAGAVIHSFYDEQDMRRMGNAILSLPFTYLAMLIGSIAILGLPFLAGFYSKDLLLELAFLRLTIDSLFVYLLGVLAALFTSIYSLRLLLLVFLGNSFSFSAHFRPLLLVEAPSFMYFSLLLLALSSILSGYLFLDLFTGLGSLF
jgi:proton-translocating NADH-quinone oxidoreductase chain L